MGSAQPALAEGSTPAGQIEPRSGYVISEQCPLGGADAPSAYGSEDMKNFGKAEGDLFASKDNSHCPTYYSKDRDALAHDWPNLLLYAFPRSPCFHRFVRRVREQGHKVAIGGPLVEEPPWLFELTQLLTAAPWPVPLRRDSSLRRTEQYGTLDRAVGSPPLAARREPTGLPERVLNTISEARAPSTRRLYALKWSVSPLGASTVVTNPSTSELAVVCPFCSNC